MWPAVCSWFLAARRPCDTRPTGRPLSRVAATDRKTSSAAAKPSLAALCRYAFGWPRASPGRGARRRAFGRRRDPICRMGILARTGFFRRSSRVAGLSRRTALHLLEVRKVVTSIRRVVLQTDLEFVFPSHRPLRLLRGLDVFKLKPIGETRLYASAHTQSADPCSVVRSRVVKH